MSRGAAARAAAPTVASALAAIAYLVVSPATADLAAHDYRAWLFETRGFELWNPNWYGGHHVPAYSVLFPPLGALLGPRLAGSLAAIAAVAIGGRLLRAQPRGELASWLLAAGVLSSLWVGRMPFVLGLAFALAAWAAGPSWARAALALACGWSSPVAGLFLAVCGAVRRDPWLAVPAIAGPLALTLLFPEGGHERFVSSAFWPIFVISLAGVALLRGRLREAAALNAAMLAAAFAIDTAVGQNGMRLATTLGPVALAVGARNLRVAAVVGVALLYLQWLPAVRAVSEADGDPAARAAFHEPAARYLAERLQDGQRVEVVFTRNHWEATHLAKRVPLARGWERQLDLKYNALFYEGRLTDRRYRAWLRESRVAFVALPDAPLDFSAEAEADLLETWPRPARVGGWRIWRVPLRLQSGELGQRWSRYWSVGSGEGCVRRLPDGWAATSGTARAAAKLLPDRCSDGPGR
jgi:hypothetical protein